MEEQQEIIIYSSPVSDRRRAQILWANTALFEGCRIFSQTFPLEWHYEGESRILCVSGVQNRCFCYIFTLNVSNIWDKYIYLVHKFPTLKRWGFISTSKQYSMEIVSFSRAQISTPLTMLSGCQSVTSFWCLGDDVGIVDKGRVQLFRPLCPISSHSIFCVFITNFLVLSLCYMGHRPVQFFWRIDSLFLGFLDIPERLFFQRLVGSRRWSQEPRVGESCSSSPRSRGRPCLRKPV